MDDSRVWSFEESLWTGDSADYHDKIDSEALLVVPAPPFILHGEDAADAMAATPRWSSATFSEQRITRPQEGLIVVAYHIAASRDGGSDYEAHCTSTYRRLAHEDWRVVQHQQTPKLAVAAQ
jgi:hypothetical protein